MIKAIKELEKEEAEKAQVTNNKNNCFQFIKINRAKKMNKNYSQMKLQMPILKLFW